MRESIDSAELREMLIDAFSDVDGVVFTHYPPIRKSSNDAYLYLYRSTAIACTMRLYYTCNDNLVILCDIIIPNPKRFQIAIPYRLDVVDSQSVLAAYQDAYMMAKVL